MLIRKLIHWLSVNLSMEFKRVPNRMQMGKIPSI